MHFGKIRARNIRKDEFLMFPMYTEAEQDGDLIIAQIETQGWRPAMEDFIMSRDIEGLRKGDEDKVFGIFDGHGGHLVSLFTKVALPSVIRYNML